MARAPPGPYEVLLQKLLLTNEQVGALIGKGGREVVAIQSASGTTVKVRVAAWLGKGLHPPG
jgi:predicted RNA-binding protein YlqC (UPF0109 family)